MRPASRARATERSADRHRVWAHEGACRSRRHVLVAAVLVQCSSALGTPLAAPGFMAFIHGAGSQLCAACHRPTCCGVDGALDRGHSEHVQGFMSAMAASRASSSTALRFSTPSMTMCRANWPRRWSAPGRTRACTSSCWRAPVGAGYDLMHYAQSAGANRCTQDMPTPVRGLPDDGDVALSPWAREGQAHAVYRR